MWLFYVGYGTTGSSPRERAISTLGRLPKGDGHLLLRTYDDSISTGIIETVTTGGEDNGSPATWPVFSVSG